MLTKTQKKFIDPESVLFEAGLKVGQNVADLGAGSGFYALAAAKIVGSEGAVHVADVKESSLDHVVAEARMHGHKSIKTYRCDLDENEIRSCKLPEGQCHMVILANILHEVENRNNLLKHSYEMLQTGGRLVVVDWNKTTSYFGPPAEKRISEEEAKKLVTGSSFKFIKNLIADDYHFALVFEK
jgi:ubiquinone/menaquinone biosynthesis C-methylase UbiE